MTKHTPDDIRLLLIYDPETGIFKHRQRKADRFSHTLNLNHFCASWNTKFAGEEAGTVSRYGYLRITLEGHTYNANVLAWVIMKGEWPDGVVDHADLDKSNNTWRNLRKASRSQNSANQTLRCDNVSGLKGVHFCSTHGDWVARIGVRGNRIHLGRFKCPAAASFAYIVAADKHFREFARFS